MSKVYTGAVNGVNRDVIRIGDNGGPDLNERDEPTIDDRNGWVRIQRDIRNHHLVGFGKPVAPANPALGSYSRNEAWQDLIMECGFDGKTVSNNGRKMRLEPGQLLGAVTWLACRWNWTSKTVRGFLDKLEEEGMISRDENAGVSFSENANSRISQLADKYLNGSQKGQLKGRFANIISISKYSLYQLSYRQQGQVAGNVEGRLRAGRGPVEGHIYKDKQLNNVTTKQIDIGSPSGSRDPQKPKNEKVAGERLPTEWQLPKSWGDWAIADCGVTDDQVRAQAEIFRDYWVSTPGAKGRKSDWEATWRNWCRRADWAKAGTPKVIEDAFERELNESLRPGEDRWTARQRLKKLKGLR